MRGLDTLALFIVMATCFVAAAFCFIWGIYTLFVAGSCDGLVYWNPMAYCVVNP